VLRPVAYQTPFKYAIPVAPVFKPSNNPVLVFEMAVHPSRPFTENIKE
jgi:hypothetical protein